MKYLFISFLMISTFQLTFAQSTSTKSSNKINISIDGDNKLKFDLDDEKMDLNYKFPKEKTPELMEAFSTHLQATETIDVTKKSFTAKKKGYEILIKQGKLQVSLDRTQLNDEDAKQLLAGTQAALKAFGMNVNASIDWD